MCQGCKVKHDNKSRNRSHVSRPVTQSTVQYLTCQMHDTHVEAFCVDCSRAVCSVCIFDDHDEHSIHDFSREEDDLVKSLEKLINKTEEVTRHAARLAEMKRRVNTDLDAVQSEVDGHYTLMLKNIKQQHTDLCRQIKDHRQLINVEIAKSQKLIKEAEATIAKLRNHSKSWRQPLPEITSVRLAGVERLADGIKRQIPSLTDLYQEPKTLTFKPAEILSVGELLDAVEDLRVTDKKSFSQAQLVWKVYISVLVHGVDFLLSDEFVILGSDDGIRVLDLETGQNVTHDLSLVCDPSHTRLRCDVAASRTADIVVAVTYLFYVGCLHIMTADGGRWRETHVVDDDSCHVALTTDNNILVGSRYRNSLTKYNIQGVELGQIALSSAPRYICTDNTNRIIVSHNDHVTVYDGSLTVYDGSREMLSLPAATEQRKLKPVGVCTDSDDNIYICDQESSTVLKYDRRGQYMDAIKLEDKPERVAIYKDRLLAVATCGDECVDEEYPVHVLLYRL